MVLSDHKAHRVLREFKDYLVHKAQQAQMVLMARQVHRAQRVQLDVIQPI